MTLIMEWSDAFPLVLVSGLCQHKLHPTLGLLLYSHILWICNLIHEGVKSWFVFSFIKPIPKLAFMPVNTYFVSSYYERFEDGSQNTLPLQRYLNMWYWPFWRLGDLITTSWKCLIWELSPFWHIPCPFEISDYLLFWFQWQLIWFPLFTWGWPCLREGSKPVPCCLCC